MISHAAIEKFAKGIAEAEDGCLVEMLKAIISVNIIMHTDAGTIKQICIDGRPRYQITTLTQDGVSTVVGKWI